MAVAFGAATTDGTAAGAPEATRTFSHTCSGSQRLLIVSVCNDEDGSAVNVSSITYAGVALTQRITATRSNFGRASLWYLVNPASGANNVIVTLASAQEWTAAAVSFTGVNQTTPLGTAASANGFGSTASVNVSSASDELVYDTVNVNGPVTLTAGASQTSRWTREASTSSTVVVDSGGSTETGAATTTMSWGVSPADDWVIVAVPIREHTGTSGSMSVSAGGRFAVSGVAGPDYDYQVVIRF